MSDTTSKLKHIAIDQYNYDRLAKLGQVPMSFNQVVSMVLDEYYNTIIKKKEQQEPLLATSTPTAFGVAGNKS